MIFHYYFYFLFICLRTPRFFAFWYLFFTFHYLLLTSDYSFGCDIGSGGLKEAYLIELENISGYTESSGTLTAITKVAGKIFRKYQLVQDTASATEDLTGNLINGTLFYAQKAVIVINKQNVAVRNEILLLAKNRLVMIVVDNNDTYRLYGRLNGLRLQTGQAGSGTAWGDRNGYNLEFAGNERELAPFVASGVLATLQT